MKLTLEIPNEHAPALLALLSDLMPVRLETQADPAEGHPELPLMPATPSNDLAAKWIAAGGDVPPTPEQLAAMASTPEPDPWDLPPYTDAEPAGFAAGTNGKLEVIALDENNPDMTQRVLSWPQELLSVALPEHPEGKTRWVYRGTFNTYKFQTGGREVFYFSAGDSRWIPTTYFSGFFHHIEAI